jgi:transposase
MAQKKKWSAALKFEIALQAVKEDTTLSVICKRYEVSPSQVHAWKKQLLEQGADVFGKSVKMSTVVADHDRLQRQLYEKVGQLTMERDFLKKSWEKLPTHGDKD